MHIEHQYLNQSNADNLEKERSGKVESFTAEKERQKSRN